MIELLAEAVKKSSKKVVKIIPTPTATPIPETSASGLNMENFITDFFSFFANFDYQLVFKAILMVILFMWFLVIIWIVLDASQRYKKWYSVVFWIILILPFNILGLLAYFAIRPHYTNEEKEWSQLEIKYLEHELLSTTHCRQCGKMVQTDHQFCWHCGEDLQWKCRECKHSNSVGYQYCINCGLALAISIKSNKVMLSYLEQKNVIINKKEDSLQVKKLLLVEKKEQLKVKKKKKKKKKNKFKLVVTSLFKKMRERAGTLQIKLKNIVSKFQQKNKNKLVKVKTDPVVINELQKNVEENKAIENSLEAYLSNGKTDENSKLKSKQFRHKKKRRKIHYKIFK